MWAAVAAASTAAAAAARSGPIAVHNMTAPFEPMSLALHGDRLAYGARDCPKNSRNEMGLLDVNSGRLVRRVGATGGGAGQIAAGVQKGELHIAGMGWDKVRSTTTFAAFRGDRGEVRSARISGEPAMWSPIAVTGDGAVAAALFEPTPDRNHINNRSGELLVFTDNPASPAFRFQIDGLGEADPQAVAISSSGPVYTVAAVMGFRTMVWDVHAGGEHELVYNVESVDPVGPEPVIAVEPAGRAFAISRLGNVVVHARAAPGGKWATAATLKPPDAKIYSDLGPIAMSWSTRPGAASLLAVGWTGLQGDAVAVSTHPFTATGVPAGKGWSHAAGCDPSSPYFDDLVSAGLAVSPGGEYVALGSWGCGPQNLNFLIFKGLGGDGKPALGATSPGQIWAVAVDVDAGGAATAAYGSWSSATDSSIRAQLAVFRV